MRNPAATAMWTKIANRNPKSPNPVRYPLTRALRYLDVLSASDLGGC